MDPWSTLTFYLSEWYDQQKEDINMTIDKDKDNTPVTDVDHHHDTPWSYARYSDIKVGDEVSIRNPHTNTKGTVTFIEGAPEWGIDERKHIKYHVVWNTGLIGKYERDQILRTGKKYDITDTDICASVRSYIKHDEQTIKQVINDIYGYKSDHRPHPKFVMYNQKGADAYTTVVWKDGSHTVVKLAAGDQYDEEKAIMFAVMKKMCGDNGCEMGRYFEEFFDHEITHGDE